MPMYNLIEDSDNYQDSSATLYQYKRDEPPEADAVADLTANNSGSLKYKNKLLGNATEVAGDAAAVGRLNVKVIVPLKYLSNFFTSLEMPLSNCKIKLNLTWKKECVLSTGAGEALFIINDTKLYVPVVTLSKEDNKDFIDQQNKGFQRSIYWNEYKAKEINEDVDANVFKYINLDPSFQGVNRLFVMAYNRVDGQPTRNGQRKYYLPRISLNTYYVIIDGRNLYDTPIGSINGSGVKLIIEQEDMNDIMKIIEALENCGILLKGVTKTIENETKEQRGGFLGMLLGTLGASLLGNLLTGGKGIMRASDRIVRAGEGS